MKNEYMNLRFLSDVVILSVRWSLEVIQRLHRN